jgi:fused signal recognition particle receptor
MTGIPLNGASIWVLALLGVLFVTAVVLLVAARRRTRSLSAPPPPPAELPASRPAVVIPPRPPPEKSLPAEVETAEQRRERKDREEAVKREAYRARKEHERSEREERQRQAEIDAQRALEEVAEKEAQEARERAAEAEARRQREQAEAGKTLLEGLSKTRGGFMSRLNAIFGERQAVSGEVLGELEEVLFSADIGVKTASRLIQAAREDLGRRESTQPDRLKQAIREEIERIVTPASSDQAAPAAKPRVWMIVGVNGAGKTTTIGKLAAHEAANGRKVVLGAADTFRAAATEQLAVWAQRAGVEIVRGSEGSDPASVAHEAVRRGIETGADLVIIDTAGRLHTKLPLMEELKKVKRVLEKVRPGGPPLAPDEVLLVLDSTNGQNAIAQARQFHEALGVTGIALTKLDGTAKGGVVIGISEELHIPVRYIGIGEAVGDLRPFDPHAFVDALFA